MKKYTHLITFILIVLLGLIFQMSYVSAQDILVDGNMESNTGWTVYYGTANQANYQFNYTTNKPSKGNAGCLRVTSAVSCNILFWQKIKLKAGKKYIVDGAVKTNVVTNFFCEYYLSTIAPVNGSDYSPNSNGDVIRGLSTWAGCGSNIDGVMSQIACTGKRSFICPGTAGTDVDVYFAIKTGTTSTISLEVLLDEVSVKEIDDSRLISAEDGTIDQDLLVVTATPSITMEKLVNGLTYYSNATISITGNSGTIYKLDTLKYFTIRDTFKINVTGALGTRAYSIASRSLSPDKDILSTTIGALDNVNFKITGMPLNVKVIQLKSAISFSKNATLKILNASNFEPSANTIVSVDFKAQVTAEDGTKTIYTIEFGSDNLAVETLTDYKATVSSISNKNWELAGSTQITFTASNNPLQGSTINLLSDNVWLFFDSIKPQDFANKYLAHFLVNGALPANNSNIRLVQYYNGTVIISQPSTYKPLTVYTNDNLAGTPMDLGIYTYYRSAELDTLNDNIQSFRLKRGYMATFARDDEGTGYSKVFMAIDSDLVVKTLPVGLPNKVSFIRVVPWRWVTKKGWCGGETEANKLLCTWNYDWNNATISSNNVEYIPMRHNLGWNSYENINSKQNSTHALGFNEPDRPDQANMTVAQAIAAWPNLLKSGLRLGSPCPSDGGLTWLYNFIDQCDALNYRVDYVAMHWYLGCQTARQYYDRLKAIYDRTKRPIWITEWNNGANWTSCIPTYEEQEEKIRSFITMLDTTSFVERYAIYEWLTETHKMFYGGTSILTPAGKVYKEKLSPKAYNPKYEYTKTYVPLALPAVNPMPSDKAIKVGVDTVLRWTNGNSDVSNPTYRVYFGKTSPPPLVAQSTNNYYNPGTLEPSTIYYWRINTIAADVEIPGPYWTFLTTDSASSVQGTIEYAGVGNGMYIGSAIAADINNDNNLDIIYSGDNRGGPARIAGVAINNGNAGFTVTQALTPLYMCNFATGDLDGDGNIDIAQGGWNFWSNMNNILKSSGTNTLTTTSVAVASVNSSPSCGIADFDNNGYPDYFFVGNGNANNFFYQKSDRTFNAAVSKLGTTFNFADPCAVYADFDNDKDIDLGIVSNNGTTDKYTRIWLNDGNGSFTQKANEFIQRGTRGSMSYADIDGDGDLDILLNGSAGMDGETGDLYANRHRLYINNGSGGFTKAPNATYQEFYEYTPTNVGKMARFVDWDNDGDYDIVLGGWNASQGSKCRTHVYLNNGTGLFYLSPENIPGVAEQSYEIGDFNNDNKIDLLISGNNNTAFNGSTVDRTIAVVYLNSQLLANNPPAAPTSLDAITTNSNVSLTWARATDTETKNLSLTYNFYVRDVSSGKYLIAPLADVATGKRKVADIGNAYCNLGWNLKNLPNGTYAWSVQAIDAGYAGSAFAPEMQFVINSVGTEKLNVNQLRIFPNPVKNMLIIENLNKPALVSIYSVEGKLISKQNINTNTVDVSNLLKGVYTISIKTDKKQIVNKFIKD
jgi:hypothetical protein